MTLIGDEAVEAARSGFVSVDEPDLSEGLQLQYRLRAALTAALPHIVEEIAREYDRKAESHAAECHRREVAGKHVRMGEFAKSGTIRGIADYLRSLAPMGER